MDKLYEIQKIWKFFQNSNYWLLVLKREYGLSDGEAGWLIWNK